MAAPKFYRKPSPVDPVILSNGSRVLLKSADYQTGYLATDNDFIQKEFDALISQQRFGLSEISYDEYNESYLKKKTGQPLKKPCREEITSSGIRANPLTQALAAGKPAAAEDKNAVVLKDCRTTIPIAMEELPASAKTEVEAPTPPESFRPNLGRRF